MLKKLMNNSDSDNIQNIYLFKKGFLLILNEYYIYYFYYIFQHIDVLRI